MGTGKADAANVNGADGPLQVVIVGAGPAGLLLANYLLERGNGQFRVRIVEHNEDPRVIAVRPPTRMRYSVFLAPRGILAIKGVEGLLPRVLAVGDLCESTTLYNSKGKVIVKLTKESTPKRIRERGDEYCRMLYIDRMELSGALLDALLDRHGASGLLDVYFSTSCASLDLRARTVNVEPRNVANVDEAKTSSQPPVPGLAAAETWTYDLLVGADGVNSVVRNALARQSFGFDHSMSTTFSVSRTMKCPLPEKIPPRTFHIYSQVPGCKEMSAFLIPEKEKTRTLMVGLGWHKHKPPTKFLAISEVSEMKAFVKKSFPAIGDIPDDAAAQLLTTKDFIVPRSVKCNRYHDANSGVVLIGDAAHATFPNIGQGCNAALTDVTVLSRLLCGETVTHDNKNVENVLAPQGLDTPLSASEIRNRIPLILLTYSALQVRDGRALVDLSYALDCFDPRLRQRADLKFILRDIIATILGSRVSFSAQMAVATLTTPYADIWDRFRTTLDPLIRANIQIEDEWMKAESVKLLKVKEEKFA